METINTIEVNGVAHALEDPDALSFAQDQQLTEDQQKVAQQNISLVQNDKVNLYNVWSSQKTVDTLCPTLELEGLLISCMPVESYPLEVTAVGAGEFIVTVCGKNLYDKDAFPITSGKYIKADGNTTNSTGYACTEGFIPVTHLQGKKITLNHPPAETNGSNPKTIFYTDADASTYISGSGKSGYTLEVPSNANYMRFSTPKAYADGTQIQIEIGSVDPEDIQFEQYHSNTAAGADGKAVVTALKGLNNVFAYSGDNAVKITVAVRADPVAIIEKLTNAVISLGGNI